MKEAEEVVLKEERCLEANGDEANHESVRPKKREE